jgi:hypothetical protein
VLSFLTRLLKRSSAGSPPNKASDVLWSKAGVSLSIESKRFVELGVGALARGEHAQAQAHWQVAREAPAAHIDAWVLAAQHSTPPSDSGASMSGSMTVIGGFLRLSRGP